MNIEPLESRIAPASVFPYTDADGDKVSIILSTGTLGVALLAGPNGSIATVITVTGAASGANLTVAVTKVAGGDGLANVGFINAANIDLGTVNVKGDLGRIVCGDGDPEPAIKSLLVRSMGRFGTATQGGGGDLLSFISGDVGTVKVTGDVEDVYLGISGKVGSLTIGGSLLGGAATDNGRIFVTSGLSKLMIAKNIVGGAGTRAGSVEGLTGLGSVMVGGSVIGGAGLHSGAIMSNGDLVSVKIGKELVGGTGELSGVIVGGDDDDILKVTIGGSITGGTGTSSGGVFAGNPASGIGTSNLGDVSVGGSVMGGFGARSGAIFSWDQFGAVKIAHDLIGGTGDDTGTLDSHGDVRSLSIGGSVVGGSGYSSGVFDANGGDVTGGIKIGGSIKGGSNHYTGYVAANNIGGSVMVGGSVIGGVADPNGGSVDDSGEISLDNVKSITVLGDLVGGSISGTASMARAGRIAADNVGSIVIGGSIFAGIDTSGSDAIDLESGGIFVVTAGSITVKGSIVGNTTSRASIFVEGHSAGTPGVALGKLTVGGNVEHTLIEVGTDTFLSARNGSVGAVKVSGDWIASSLASAISSGNTLYGDGDDALIAGAVSRIASITIGGAITGLKAPGAFFAFTADDIGAFKASGTSFPRTPLINDPAVAFSPETGGNVLLREL